MKRAVIIFGPPGAGKGTQAELLAERHGFRHFETSRVLEQAFTQKDRDAIEIDGVRYPFAEEQRKFLSGELCTPEVVAHLLKDAISDLSQHGHSVVFSGSPRTQFESEHILPILEAEYGKDRVHAFSLTCAKKPRCGAIASAAFVRCVVCRTRDTWTKKYSRYAAAAAASLCIA